MGESYRTNAMMVSSNAYFCAESAKVNTTKAPVAALTVQFVEQQLSGPSVASFREAFTLSLTSSMYLNDAKPPDQQLIIPRTRIDADK